MPRRLLLRTACFCALLVLVFGCHETRASKDTDADPPPPSTAQPAVPRGPARRPVVHFEGACDASGAVPLDAHRFAVADDEDSVLRIYDAERGGPPLYTVDVSGELGLATKQRKNKKKPKRDAKPRKLPETDIEAATAIGERAYWITSHARTKSGKRDPARFRFFATALPREMNIQQPIGIPYTGLVDDMLSDPRLVALGLDRAVEVPPTEGGLNIEGLTATPDGKLMIGLRQPVTRGKAVVLTLENADAVLQGAKAKFGAPALLDLGGLGVRALSWWRGSYWVVAGSGSTGPGSRLYRWNGTATPRLTEVNFGDLNPEGFFTPEARGEILVLSDDGTRLVAGEPCKELANADQKRFRGLWLDLAHP